MDFFVGYLVAGFAVGALAQLWKRRTGILWGILTFPAYWFWWLVSIRVEKQPGTTEAIADAVNATFAGLFGAGTLAIIVATFTAATGRRGG